MKPRPLPWGVPYFSYRPDRQARMGTVIAPATSPRERWFILIFVNDSQTPECPFHAEPVHILLNL